MNRLKRKACSLKNLVPEIFYLREMQVNGCQFGEILTSQLKLTLRPSLVAKMIQYKKNATYEKTPNQQILLQAVYEAMSFLALLQQLDILEVKWEIRIAQMEELKKLWKDSVPQTRYQSVCRWSKELRDEKDEKDLYPGKAPKFDIFSRWILSQAARFHQKPEIIERIWAAYLTRNHPWLLALGLQLNCDPNTISWETWRDFLLFG